MRDIILIYNPKAGNTNFRFSLDRFIEIFSEKGLEIRVFRSRRPGDMAEYLKECDLSLTQAVFVAGGNGTINEVVNAMMEIHCKIPIGVIPAGLDNDFAKTLGFGEDLEENLKALSAMTPMAVDVASANGRYFVNMCSAGTVASLTTVSSDMKNMFGRMAYYIKGIGAIPKMHKMHLQINVDGEIYTGSFVLFIMINTKLRRQTKDEMMRALTDGQYDLIAVKIGGISNIARVLMQVAKREPIKEKDILYLTGKHFVISVQEGKEEAEIPTEIDGEMGPALPLEVKVYKGALTFFVNP